MADASVRTRQTPAATDYRTQGAAKQAGGLGRWVLPEQGVFPRRPQTIVWVATGNPQFRAAHLYRDHAAVELFCHLIIDRRAKEFVLSRGPTPLRRGAVRDAEPA